MYAVIETGAKQYQVKEGDVIKVEKLQAEVGEGISFDKVLLVSDDNGIKAGKPILEGVKVEAEVLEQGKAKKVIVFRYRAKKNYRKKNGHRQPYTKVKIKSIAY